MNKIGGEKTQTHQQSKQEGIKRQTTQKPNTEQVNTLG